MKESKSRILNLGELLLLRNFAYILKNQHHATIVGEPTNGGAHLIRSFSLGNGFVGFIPCLRSENEKTHTDREGTGYNS